MSSLAEHLKEARQRRGLTQLDIAERSGVSDASLSRIENGLQSPTVDILTRILPHYGLSAELVARHLLKPGTLAPDDAADREPATLPHDPLAAVTQALQQGPWPENISAAVYALLAAAADDKRALWERRFDEALAQLSAEGADDPVIVSVLDSTVEPTPELRTAIEEVVRTQRAVDGYRLRNALFASGARGERR